MPLRYIFLFFFTILSACVHHESEQTSYPYYQVGQVNAKIAIKELNMGYTDEAQSELELALERAPRDPQVLATVGYYYEKTGELNKANQYYMAALLYAPHSGLTRNNYGAFLCRNDNFEESITYFRAATVAAHPFDKKIAQENALFCRKELQQLLGDNAIYAYHSKNNG